MSQTGPCRCLRQALGLLALPLDKKNACSAQQQDARCCEEAHKLLPSPSHALLLQGLCGAVCFWVDVMDPLDARFPGYEL